MLYKEYIEQADVLLNTIYPQPNQPCLIPRSVVKTMKKDAVIIDIVGVGVIGTVHYTSLEEPIYFEEGILHYNVANMPALCPKTSTKALLNVSGSYIQAIANKGLKKAFMDSVNIITSTLAENFVIHPLLILPIFMVVGMIFFKIPAIPGIFLMALVGALCGVFVQGCGIADAINSIHYGYVGTTGIEMVDSLLTRGGMNSMLGTASLILCAISYGGILEATGVLKILVNKVLNAVKKDGTLVLSTIISCIVLNMIAVDNYVTAVIIGSIFKKAYIKRGLHPLNLSRCLAECAAITSPLIPWNTCGIVMVGMLGVSPVEYAPFAFLCWVPSIVVTVSAYLNICLKRLTEEEQKSLMTNDN